MGAWCSKKMFRKECPVLGADIFTNNPRVCQEYNLWQDKPCWHEDLIRCKAGDSGQCVDNFNWGIEGEKHWDGSEASCKDGSDLYRPIVKGEEPGSQTPQKQVWNTRPIDELEYNTLRRQGEGAEYRKDPSTGLWMAALTEETCMANAGFVCQVRHGGDEVGECRSHIKNSINLCTFYSNKC